MTLAAGTKLGPYEILAPIGAGGMGEVYRARDPRLGRDVAIKVLPASFSQDPDRLKRFEQEARAAGVLNHPNITAVYDFGTHDGAPYIVTELLEGETLRSRLRPGALSPRKAIDYAVQIAKGLAAAHEKGIVHRDLKPENLFVTKDGRVKILDFGLAKLKPETAPRAADATADGLGRHRARRRARDDGLHVARAGARASRRTSAATSSPSGRSSTRCSSGQRAFRGDTAADTITAILTKEPPDLSQTNKDVPAGSRPDRAPLPGEEPGGAVRVGARRRLRPRDAVGRLRADGSDRRWPAAPKRARWIGPALIAARRRARRAASPPGYSRTARRPASFRRPTFQQLTFRRGEVYSARFAPDGQTVIYAAAWDGRPVEIFATRTDRPESRVFGLVGADVLAISKAGEMAVSLDRHNGAAFIAQRHARRDRRQRRRGPARRFTEDVQWADWAPGRQGTGDRAGRGPAKPARVPDREGPLPDRGLDQPSRGSPRRATSSRSWIIRRVATTEARSPSSIGPARSGR